MIIIKPLLHSIKTLKKEYFITISIEYNKLSFLKYIALLFSSQPITQYDANISANYSK